MSMQNSSRSRKKKKKVHIDYSFLKMCKMGYNHLIPSNLKLNPVLLDKVSAVMKLSAPSPTCRGRSASERTISWSETLPTGESSHTSEVNTLVIKNNKTCVITNPSQVVAEAIEATPEVVRSTSKAREAAEGDVEAAGEAGQERPQDVHGADPGHGRLTDTDNRIPFVQHVIEAHPY